MKKYFRISTGYGFCGTDENRIVYTENDNIDAEGLYQEEWENMVGNLSCDVEEIDLEDLDEDDLEYAEEI